MKNSYTQAQAEAERAMFAAMTELQANINECDRKAVEAKGGPLTDEYMEALSLSMDADGNPVKDANYWAIISKNLSSTLNVWISSYTKMFPDSKQRNNGRSIMHRLADAAETSANA